MDPKDKPLGNAGSQTTDTLRGLKHMTQQTRSAPTTPGAPPTDDAETWRRRLARRVRRGCVKALPRAPYAARRSTPPVPPRAAYGTVLGLWLIFFSLGIVTALLFVAGAWAAPTEAYTAAKALTRATDDIAQTAAAVWLVALLAYRYQLTRAQLGWRPDLRARRSFRQQGVLTAVLYTVALAAAIGLMGWLQEAGLGGHGYPHPPPGAPGVLPAVTDAVNAGIVEELVLVAALVTVLEHAHQPPWRIYTIGMIVRWSFHIYYGNLGWGMLTTLPLMLWAAAAIGLFRWTRRITPLIGVHIGWDLQAGLISQTGQILIVYGVLAMVVIALVAWVYYWEVRDRRQARRRLHAAVPAAAAAAGVPTPRVSLSAAVNYPQLQQTWHGKPVLRYRPAAAIRHTDEQMTGLLAHELQHLAGHDPLPHTATQTSAQRPCHDRRSGARASARSSCCPPDWPRR